MRTLVPAQFLRVADKFFAGFALADDDLKQGPTLLYLYLFFLSHQRDFCWPSHAHLARACKCTERSIQTYMQALVTLGYIRVERHEGKQIYRLIVSDRVCRLIAAAGADLFAAASATPAPSANQKNFPVRGEKFSPYIRDNKNTKSPLSPLPSAPPTPLTSSSHSTSPCQGGCSPVPESGRGDSPRENASANSPRPASPPSAPNPAPRAHRRTGGVPFAAQKNDDGEAGFERLYAAWPLKKDKLHASQVFRRLHRSGELPSLQHLLAVVERFKAEDRSWRNGCVPNLAYWLKGHRWLDEVQPPVVPAYATASTTASSGHYGSVTTSPTDAQLAARIQSAHEQIVSQVVENVPAVSSEVNETVEVLTALWPDAPRGQIMCSLLLARQRGAHYRDILARAQEERLYKRDTLPVAEWMKTVEF